MGTCNTKPAITYTSYPQQTNEFSDKPCFCTICQSKCQIIRILCKKVFEQSQIDQYAKNILSTHDKLSALKSVDYLRIEEFKQLYEQLNRELRDVDSGLEEHFARIERQLVMGGDKSKRTIDKTALAMIQQTEEKGKSVKKHTENIRGRRKKEEAGQNTIGSTSPTRLDVN